METDAQLDEVGETTPLFTRAGSTDKSQPAAQVSPGGRSHVTLSSGSNPENIHANGYIADHSSAAEVHGVVIFPVDREVHCHASSPTDDPVRKKARNKLIAVSIVCLFFMAGEVVGGIIANSLAIATDAAHLLSDLAGFLISLFAVYISSRPATKRMSFGWHRAEVMGAILSVLIIWVVTIVLVYMAVQRVLKPDYVIDATIMLIMALLSIVFNIVMILVLTFDPHAHGHSHGGGGHGHSHAGGGHSHRKNERSSVAGGHQSSYGTTGLSSSSAVGTNEPNVPAVVVDNHVTDERRHEKTNVNVNVRAAIIHAIGDLIQSIGVFAAAMIIYFKPEYKIADPICTFVFSVLVMATTFSILKDTLNVLMEAVPKDLSFNDIRSALCAIEGVTELHDLRLWSLTTNRPALSVHLAIDNAVDTQQVLLKAREVVQHSFQIYECTFQVERYVPQMEDCDKCRDPKD